MFKLDLEKVEEPEIKCQHTLDHRESKRIPEIHYFCFTDYTKGFDCVDHNQLWKILQEIGIPGLLRNLYAGQEASVRNGWNNRLVPNRERSMSKLYIVSLLI